MKSRMALLSLAVVVALTGCGGAPTPAADPASTPAPSVPSSPPTVAPTAAGPVVALPADCASLVRTSAVQDLLGVEFVPIVLPTPYSPDAQVFADRGGLVCMWGIPQSDASITVFAAPRATASDAEQENLWRTAGYSECPPFLDVCLLEVVPEDMGGYSSLHVLVAGFELEVAASVEEIDTLLILAREASNNMGYL